MNTDTNTVPSFTAVTLTDIPVVLASNNSVIINGLSYEEDTASISVAVMDSKNVPLMTIGGKTKFKTESGAEFKNWLTGLMQDQTKLILTKEGVLTTSGVTGGDAPVRTPSTLRGLNRD